MIKKKKKKRERLKCPLSNLDILSSPSDSVRDVCPTLPDAAALGFPVAAIAGAAPAAVGVLRARPARCRRGRRWSWAREQRVGPRGSGAGRISRRVAGLPGAPTSRAAGRATTGALQQSPCSIP